MKQMRLDGGVPYAASEFADVSVRKRSPVGLASKAQRLKVDEKVAQETAVIERVFQQHLSHDERTRRQTAINKLQKQIDNDSVLPLRETMTEKNQIVYGKGTVSAHLFVICCMPTIDEASTGDGYTSGLAKILLDELAARGIDPAKHCWLTYFMKIRPPGRRVPSYEVAKVYLQYLRKELAIIRPKQILCVGAVVATLASEHFQLTRRVRGYENEEEEHRLELANLWESQQLQSHIGAAKIDKLQYVARFRCIVDVKQYLGYTGQINARHRRQLWLQELDGLRDQMFLPPLVFFDPIAKLNDHLMKKMHVNMYQRADALGVEFAQPTETIVPRDSLYTNARPVDYLRDRSAPVRLYVLECKYDKLNNNFLMFTRTPEGYSCALKVTQPTFRFWMHHGCFDRNVDAQGRIDYRPPDEEGINAQLRSLVLDDACKQARFEGFTPDEIWEELCIRAFYTLKRPYLYFHKNRLRFLEIEYAWHTQKSMIKEILANIFQSSDFYETFLKPEEFFYHDRGIFAYGWIELAVDKLHEPEVVETTCDYEFEAHYDDVRGRCPNVGKSLAPADEAYAMIRFFHFDGEMLSPDITRLPTPEDAPIARLCGGLTDINQPGRPTLTQYIRNPENPRTVISTGRVNIHHRIEFVLGPHAPPAPEPFTPAALPYFPAVPACDLLHADECQPIYDWNQFIEAAVRWVEYVGWYRAKLFLRHQRSVQLLITDPLRRYEGKTTWEFENWRKTVLKLKSALLSRQGDLMIEHESIQPPAVLTTREDIGSIQADWPLFFPAPIVRFFESERDLLIAFAEYIREVDVDVLTGHNISNFDIPFVLRRIQALNLHWSDYFPKRDHLPICLNRLVSRRKQAPSIFSRDSVHQKRLETRANGTRIFSIIRIVGRDVLDTLHYAQNDLRELDGYGLSQVAKHTVGDTKHDVPYTSIAPLFYNNPKKLTDYCGQDASLVNRILTYRNVVLYILGQCRLIGCMQLGQFYTSGVQVKIIHQLLRSLKRSPLGRLMPDINLHAVNNDETAVYAFRTDCDEDDADVDPDPVAKKTRVPGYQGANVIDVVRGLHVNPIPTLDFNSMYPNIMKEKNLGQSSLGTLEWFTAQGIGPERLWSHEIEAPDPLDGNKPKLFYFLQPRRLNQLEASALPAYDDQPAGLLQCIENADGTFTPRIEVADTVAIIDDLLTARATVRAGQKGLASSSEQFRVLDALQLGYKYEVNSVYGAHGVTSGRLASPVGPAVTKRGREHLRFVETYVTMHFGARVLGGDTDSVFVEFPQIREPNDVFKEVELRCPVDDANAPVQRKRFIKHILDSLHSHLPPMMRLDFEKHLFPYLAIVKKRAGGGVLMPTRNPVTGLPEFEHGGKSKPAEKGTEGKRRSTAPYGKRVFKLVNTLITKLFQTPDKMKAEIVRVVRESVQNVLEGNFDYSETVLTRYYGKTDYASDRVPTLEICRKKRQRGEEVPALGSRIPMVVVASAKGSKFYQKVEDPLYALRHNLKLDVDYIINKHLKKPICRITDVFDRSLAQLMFPKHLYVRVNLLECDAFHRYARYENRCEFCKAPAGLDFVCAACVDARGWDEINAHYMDKLEDAKGHFENTKSKCYPCVGVQPGDTIECENVWCKEFAPRKRAEFALERYQSTLLKLPGNDVDLF